MDSDEQLAALQRNLQSYQSAQQHRDLMRQLAQLNESPAQRASRVALQAQIYEENRRSDWLWGLVICVIITVGICYIDSAQKREAALNAARERDAAQAEKAAAQAAAQAERAALEARERDRVAEIERRRIWGLSHQSAEENEAFTENKAIAFWKARAMKDDDDGSAKIYYREKVMGYKPTTGEGQYNLGVFWLTDPILGTDEGAAKTWLTKAAAQGHERAARKLAELNGPRTP